MSRTRLACVVGVAIAGLAWAAQPGVTLRIQEPWSNLFAGQEHVYQVTGLSDAPFDGRLMWELDVSGRVTDRGEQAFSDQAGPAAIRLRIPPVKPGVVMQGTLTASFVPAGQDRAAAQTGRTLWLFSQEAFADKAAWLKGLHIRLFDPVGKTIELFAKEKIPFDEIRNVDALVELKEGLLVIGEGVSFRDYRSLFDQMLKAVSAGVEVLVLAPEGGEVALPVTAAPDKPLPGRLVFRGADVITSLDKRLDASGWAPDGKSVASSLTVRGERGPVVGEFIKDSAGWPWIEVIPQQGTGRLTVCGFAIVSKWADSPTPRYLLVKLFERTEKKEN